MTLLVSQPYKIPFPTRSGIDFLAWGDILYARSDGNYTRVTTIYNKVLLVSLMISQLETILPRQCFIRIHHQYVVNIQHLIRYEKGDGGHVVMTDQVSLPVSRDRRKGFLERVMGGRKGDGR